MPAKAGIQEEAPALVLPLIPGLALLARNDVPPFTFLYYTLRRCVL
jgi:hypothetical protein